MIFYYISLSYSQKMLSIIYSFLSMILYSSAYLTFNQWSYIQKIIQHPQTPPPMRNQINQIIYQSYEKWAISQAYEFNRLHRYKSKNIDLEDYIVSSKLGLYRSVKNYRGNTTFSHYSKIYIQGQLNECLTQLYPLTNVPKKLRKQKKTTTILENREKRYYYKKRLRTLLIPYQDFWRFDKMFLTYNNEKNIQEIHEREKQSWLWNQINHSLTDSSTKRIFHYKYNAEFECIRSNKQIAELMACSEEGVRKRLEDSKQKLRVLFEVVKDLKTCS